MMYTPPLPQCIYTDIAINNRPLVYHFGSLCLNCTLPHTTQISHDCTLVLKVRVTGSITLIDLLYVSLQW